MNDTDRIELTAKTLAGECVPCRITTTVGELIKDWYGGISDRTP